MPILVVGLSHHTAPVTLRERFAFAETKIPEALQRLRDARIAEEAVILSTCNRVEIYVATSRLLLVLSVSRNRGGRKVIHSLFHKAEP